MKPKEKESEIVMLTPTQEAMQWVWEQRKSTNSKDAISALDAVYQHLQKVTLEKEQQVMCEFAIDYTMQTKTAYDFHRAKFNNEL